MNWTQKTKATALGTGKNGSASPADLSDDFIASDQDQKEIAPLYSTYSYLSGIVIRFKNRQFFSCIPVQYG